VLEWSTRMQHPSQKDLLVNSELGGGCFQLAVYFGRSDLAIL
jgi:hypothetical protein